MKREGRQHGMVRTYRILPAPLNQTNTLRFVNQIDTQPMAGLFAKVSSKPTNHSKSTGLSSTKVNKSKRRNNQKQKAIFCDDVVLRVSGASASGVLSSLYEHEDEYEEQQYDGGYGQLTIGSVYETPADDDYKDDVGDDDQDQNQSNPMEPSAVDQVELEFQVDKEASSEGEEEDDDVVVDEDGGTVTIGEMVILLEQIEEEDWCFVGADA
ncbi:unnamed protein product [Rhodiola kirilowii]